MIRPLRMVGLDLSNRATAIAATHDPSGVPFLSTFTIPGTAGRPLHEQVAAISHIVRRSCGDLTRTWKPDLVVIEGTFTRMNGSDYPLHALHSQIKQWLWQRSIPYTDVAPATLKVWATGKGTATKSEVIAGVIAAYGERLLINSADDNQADAVALLTMGMCQYGQPVAEPPAKHRRALTSVKWPALNLEVTV